MGRHERPGALFIPVKGMPPREPGVLREDWVRRAGEDLPVPSWEDARAGAAWLAGLAGHGEDCRDCAADAAGAVTSLTVAAAGQEWAAEIDGHALRILRG